MRIELAEQGEGAVWLCGECDDVHMRWQNWVLTLTREQFSGLSRMASAAELKLAGAPGPDSSKTACGHRGRTWLQ